MQRIARFVSKIILFSFTSIALLTGCKVAPPPHGTSLDQTQATVREAAYADRTLSLTSESTVPGSVGDALLPPLDQTRTKDSLQDMQKRFDVTANKTPARSFFLSLVEGTKLNMVLNPDVQGDITLNLKNVTVEEAMQAVRDLYGYDYKRTSYGFEILPQTLQTEVFPINYLDVKRTGKSLTQLSTSQISDKVTSTSAGAGGGSAGGGGGSGSGGSGGGSGSGSGSGSGGSNSPGGSGEGGSGGGEGEGGAGGGSMSPGSTVETDSVMDFWRILSTTIKEMVGKEKGRAVMVNPQSGIVIVTALPQELHRVAAYLDSIQSTMQRQVIIEAKILEVTLNDSFQAGVDWSAFGNPKGAGALLQQAGHSASGLTTGSGFFTLNYKGTFRTLIDILQQQGNVQVLSSPRISTVNNQKAIIKVGEDQFFVTGVSTSSVTSGTSVIPTSSVGLTPFFSGITLDVTPQISKEGSIILHIHPAVSEVMEDKKEIDLGNNGQDKNNVLNLPLARSTIRESDNIVRAQNGQVIVIGGLMKNNMAEVENNIPGVSKIPFFGALFRHTKQTMSKTELIILLRPVVVRNHEWSASLERADHDFQSVRRGFHFGGLAEDFGTEAEDEHS